MTQLSLVLPCFNEAAVLPATVRAIQEYLAGHYPKLHWQLLLINDGSTDDTLRMMDALAFEDQRLRILSFDSNQGRGAAIKAGIAATKGRWVIVLDADLSYDVDHIGEILSCFERHPETDVVVVSPYMKGGRVRQVPLSRLLLSRFANWLLSGFFGGQLSTVTCVVRGYRGDWIRKVPLFEDGKELHLEILRKASLQGAQVMEIPGRLIWKNPAKRARRPLGLKVMRSGMQHIGYALLIKPTRVFKYFSATLLVVGLFECFNIARVVWGHFEPLNPPDFWHSLWTALALALKQSPHTFVIASVCLILGFQAFSFLAILQVLKLQQEETLLHLIALLERKTPQKDGA